MSCSGQNAAPAPFTSPGTTDSTSPTAASETPSPTASPTPTGPDLCGPGSALNFDATAFPESPKIDNKWFPLTPGRQYTTTGKVTSAEGSTERTVVHSVTGLTKVINGVKTQVMWDQDFSDGELVESELAMLAQSKDGAVWLFGEYPEEFEGGKFMGASKTFISGIAGAEAGIAMPAQPRTGTPAYPQAHAPAVGFLDCGAVLQEHKRVCVPTGCYEDVLVIDERNPLEPDAGHQRKFYSAGTGLVQVTAVGGADQETLNLVKAEQLSDAGLKNINQHALALEQHAYQTGKTDFAKTPRAELTTETSGGK
ncbi:hypothetical protein [Arthrobacter sp. ES3-54]|uniref:hypothetical protein n=1 Tax=Arthrobacter sp. ES3-54 TaxID=1502991 RepID=UPI0024062B98|nr:hypothetical protein [Arthrobacter sp. ES3-54]